jgi:hypothetical protein
MSKPTSRSSSKFADMSIPGLLFDIKKLSSNKDILEKQITFKKLSQ